MMEKLNAALDRHVEALQRRIAFEQALGWSLDLPLSRAADQARAIERPVLVHDRVPDLPANPWHARHRLQPKPPSPSRRGSAPDASGPQRCRDRGTGRSSAVMQRQRETIAARARITFGHDGVGDRLIAAVEQNPRSRRPWPARSRPTPSATARWPAPGRWLRPDSLERQQAKAELIQLSHVVEDYGRALEAERRRVIQEHRAEQSGLRSAFPPRRRCCKPSSTPPKINNRRLTAASVRDELSRLNLSLHERLSSRERRAVAAGSTASLSRTRSGWIPARRLRSRIRSAKSSKPMRGRRASIAR